MPGDEIGPEVISESVKLLDAIAERSDFSFEYNEDYTTASTSEMGDLIRSETLRHL